MPCFGTCNTLRFNTEFMIDDKTIKTILPQKLHVLKIVKSYMIRHIYFPLTVVEYFGLSQISLIFIGYSN